MPVIGFGTDSMPAFFSRDSGLTVDVRVDSADAAARILRAQFGLKQPGGVLICVPVPAAVALSRDQAEAAIEQANERGHATTSEGSGANALAAQPRRRADPRRIAGGQHGAADQQCARRRATIAAAL